MELITGEKYLFIFSRDHRFTYLCVVLSAANLYLILQSPSQPAATSDNVEWAPLSKKYDVCGILILEELGKI